MSQKVFSGSDASELSAVLIKKCKKKKCPSPRDLIQYDLGIPGFLLLCMHNLILNILMF